MALAILLQFGRLRAAVVVVLRPRPAVTVIVLLLGDNGQATKVNLDLGDRDLMMMILLVPQVGLPIAVMIPLPTVIETVTSAEVQASKTLFVSWWRYCDGPVDPVGAVVAPVDGDLVGQDHHQTPGRRHTG